MPNFPVKDSGPDDSGLAVGDQMKTVRRRAEDVRRDAAVRPPKASDFAQGVPCRTVVLGTYPTVPKAAYYVVPIYSRGLVGEGLPVTDAEGEAILAAGYCNVVPPEGTPVMVYRRGGHYTFVYNGNTT